MAQSNTNICASSNNVPFSILVLNNTGPVSPPSNNSEEPVPLELQPAPVTIQVSECMVQYSCCYMCMYERMHVHKYTCACACTQTHTDTHTSVVKSMVIKFYIVIVIVDL